MTTNYLEKIDQANTEAFETYESLSVTDKIEMLDEEANGMGWFYSTNKEREITDEDLLKQEAYQHYIKQLEETAYC